MAGPFKYVQDGPDRLFKIEGADLLAPLVAQVGAAALAVQPITNDLAFGSASKLVAIGTDLLSGSSSIAMAASLSVPITGLYAIRVAIAGTYDIRVAVQGVYDQRVAVQLVADNLAGILAAPANADRAEAAAAQVAAAINYEQTIGRPLATPPVTSASSIGPDHYILATPLSQNGQGYRVRFTTVKAGPVTITTNSKSGDVFTRKNVVTITVPGAGAYDFGLDEIPAIAAVAGDRIGVYAPSTVCVTNATPGDSGGYYSGTYGANFTDASVSSANRIELGVSFGAISPDRFLGQRFDLIDTELATAARFGSATIGKKVAPTTGTAVADRTYAVNPALSLNSILSTVSIWALTSGTLTMWASTKSGDTFTKSGKEIQVSFIAASPQLLTLAVKDVLKIPAGQYLTIYPSAGCMAVIGASGDPETGVASYYDSTATGAGKQTTFTDTTAAPTQVLQIGFGMATYTSAPLVDRLIDAAGTGGTDLDFPGVMPTGYILVWALGQSNKAGRAAIKSSKAFEAGQAYKYVRSSTSLALLADPSGNDTSALNSGGKGSFAPSFAKTIQRLSNGKIGVIVVNSAEGGTTIVPGFASSAWASGGTARTQAITDYNTAVAAAGTLKLPIVGCCISYEEGETAGDNAVTKADYKTAWTVFQSWAAGVIGANVPIVMTRIGTTTNAEPAPTNYATIRLAQDEIAEEQPLVYMAHTGARYFLERGLMFDAYHYVVQGYDEVGEAEANTAFGVALGKRPKGYHG